MPRPAGSVVEASQNEVYKKHKDGYLKWGDVYMKCPLPIDLGGGTKRESYIVVDRSFTPKKIAGKKKVRKLQILTKAKISDIGID